MSSVDSGSRNGARDRSKTCGEEWKGTRLSGGFAVGGLPTSEEDEGKFGRARRSRNVSGVRFSC